MTTDPPIAPAAALDPDDRGRKLSREQLQALRDALWSWDLGQDSGGGRLAETVRELLQEIGVRP